MKRAIILILILATAYSCKKNRTELKSPAAYLMGTYKVSGERWYKAGNCNCYYDYNSISKVDNYFVTVTKVNDSTINIDLTSKTGNTQPFNIQNVGLRRSGDYIKFSNFDQGNNFYWNREHGGGFDINKSILEASFDLTPGNTDPSCLSSCGFHPINYNDSTVAVKTINMIWFKGNKD